MLSSYNHSMAD